MVRGPRPSKDPIVLAAEFVMVAQTIVSRQVDPQSPAVLTVGTIHGGTKNNIIPDEVTMGLTLRTYSMKVRDQIIDDIRRTANGLAQAYGIPSRPHADGVRSARALLSPSTIRRLRNACVLQQ